MPLWSGKERVASSTSAFSRAAVSRELARRLGGHSQLVEPRAGSTREAMKIAATPEMSARDVTFARKTTTIEGFLTRVWTWGDRDRTEPVDPVEQTYEVCYAVSPGIAAEMIARRRERQTLDALVDLVVYLRGAREERKAVLAITTGWLPGRTRSDGLAEQHRGRWDGQA